MRYIFTDICMSELLDLLSHHSINGDFNLFWSHTATGGDELLANVFCNSGGSVEAEKQAGLELALGVFDFELSRCRSTH